MGMPPSPRDHGQDRKADSNDDIEATPAAHARGIAADESGATAIEYALLAAGIGIAVAAAVSALGTKTESLYAAMAALLCPAIPARRRRPSRRPILRGSRARRQAEYAPNRA